MAPHSVPPEELRRLEMMFRSRNTLDNSPGVFHPFTDLSQRPMAAAAPSSSEFTDCGASASVFTVQVCEDDFGSVLRVVGAGPESQCSGFSGQQSDYFSCRPQAPARLMGNSELPPHNSLSWAHDPYDSDTFHGHLSCDFLSGSSSNPDLSSSYRHGVSSEDIPDSLDNPERNVPIHPDACERTYAHWLPGSPGRPMTFEGYGPLIPGPPAVPEDDRLHHRVSSRIGQSYFQVISSEPLSSPSSSTTPASSFSSCGSSPLQDMERFRVMGSSPSSTLHLHAGKRREPSPPLSDQEPDSRRRFACLTPGCARRFTSQYTLKVHMDAHKPKPRTSFSCTLGCPETFSRQHDRLRHEVAKHGKVCDWLCADCGRFFSSKKTLGNHKCPCAPGGTRWVTESVSCGTSILGS